MGGHALLAVVVYEGFYPLSFLQVGELQNGTQRAPLGTFKSAKIHRARVCVKLGPFWERRVKID